MKSSTTSYRGGPESDPPQIIHGNARVAMGIIIHGNLDIRMAHDVLQGFGIHTGKSHFRTEGMTHGVERHVLRQDRAELLGVLFTDAVENVLVVACHSGVARPGAEQEISIIINFDVVFSGAGQYTLSWSRWRSFIFSRRERSCRLPFGILS